MTDKKGEKEKVNMDWKVGLGSTPSIAPNQMLQREWTPQDYADNIRWAVSVGFNQPIYSSALRNGAVNTPFDNVNTGHVYQYVQAVSYLFGTQFGSEYEFVAKDSNNNPTKIPMWRGLDIRNLFAYFDGKCRAKFESMPKLLQAQGITEGIVSRKRLKLDALKKLIEAQELIKQQEQIANIKVDLTEGGVDLSKKENQEKFFRTYQDELELAYRNIGKDFLIRNYFLDKHFLKSADDTFIGGRTMTKVYDRKGRVYMRTIRPQNAIIDMSQDDDQHYNDNFAGCIEPYSIPQLQQLDNLTTEELALLQSQAKVEPNIPIAGSGYTWFNYQNNVPKIWRAEVEWKSITFIEGEPVACIREGTLIGNLILKNCRIKPNSISDKLDKSKKELDFIAFTPFTFLNTNMGIIMLVHKLIDLKSVLMTKWTEMYARAKGKINILDSSKFPAFMKTPDVLAEIEQNGLLVGNRSESEEEGTESNKMVEYIDWTLDQNINEIMRAMEYLDTQIGQILNMPKYAIQGSGEYSSEEQIANNVQSSDVGTSWLYGGLQAHYLRIVDRAIEKTILVSSKEDKDYLALTIGDGATELLAKEDIQRMLEDGFRPYLSMNNELTEKIKFNTAKIALQSAANNPNAALQYINIESAETVDEVRVMLEAERYRREQAEREKMEADRAAAERNATINANAMVQNTQTQANTTLEKAAMDNENKLTQELINKEQTT